MPVPRVIFRYSDIYDNIFRSWKEGLGERYPSERSILNYMESMKPLWKKEEGRVMKELSRTTGLMWKSRYFYCYVVGGCIPFSDPLTMPAFRNREYFIDTLVHELIHVLFMERGNMEASSKAWDHVYRKYRKETESTKMHIPLHAIHSHIYLKLFDGKRLSRDIKLISHLPDYKRSWEIVRKEGHENIIREFRERVR